VSGFQDWCERTLGALLQLHGQLLWNATTPAPQTRCTSIVLQKLKIGVLELISNVAAGVILRSRLAGRDERPMESSQMIVA